MKKIKDQKPEVIAFSVVYSSQVFYTYALIKQLNKSIKCVVGGPAVNDKLKEVAEVMFNEVEFLEFLSGKVNHNDLNTNYYLDYSQLKDYFVPKLVIPLKTTSTCFYRGCTFCNHYKDVSYQEYSLKIIRETVVNSNEKFFFLVDDMISVKRLLQLAEIFGSLGVEWACQLRPTRDLTLEILKKLKGLKFVIWGVESGSDRILKLMNKGTIRKDVETVLRDAHQIGIKNVLYMMIGFPTETKIELKETIDFLENNQENIDLVSTSVFGLQKDTFVYCNPRRFGIKKIIEEKRTILEPKILYEVENPVDTIVLRKKYYQIVGQINKYPKGMNFFREHMFFV